MNLPSAPTPRRRTNPLLCVLCVALLLPLGWLVSCFASPHTTPPSDSDTTSLSDEASTDASSQETADLLNPPSPDASLSDLRAYYESLVAELNQLLLDERADRFITEHEYEKQLAQLQEALARLEDAMKAAGKDTTDDDASQTVDGSPTISPETPSTDLDDPTTNSSPPQDDAPHRQPSSSDEDLFSNFTYTINHENSQVTITGYRGTSSTVTVPSTIEGHPVTAIGHSAFKNTDVTSVVLPHTVTSVGWFAFYGCHGLESVALPASVSIISYAAFDGCPSVTLICAADSYAARYAASFGLRHRIT